MPDHALLAVVL